MEQKDFITFQYQIVQLFVVIIGVAVLLTLNVLPKMFIKLKIKFLIMQNSITNIIQKSFIIKFIGILKQNYSSVSHPILSMGPFGSFGSLGLRNINIRLTVFIIFMFILSFV